LFATELAGKERGVDGGGEEGFREFADRGVDVEVLGCAVHAVGRVAVVSRVACCGAVLVHVDGDVGGETAEQRLDITCLLACEACVVAIWIVVGS
jgi:hypothetical protein